MTAGTASTAETLTEEHVAYRAAVRELGERYIAPHAAEADETGEFPERAYHALMRSKLHEPHIPASYGGEGADALATAIAVEEIARCCATSGRPRGREGPAS